MLQEFFILQPSGDSATAIASRNAMLIYANSIEASDPMLAQKLRTWVGGASEKPARKFFGSGVR